jgi:hypothetical protein
MSPDFVRYSPEVETFDPKLSEYMTQIIEFWKKKLSESWVAEGSGRAARDHGARGGWPDGARPPPRVFKRMSVSGEISPVSVSEGVLKNVNRRRILGPGKLAALLGSG